MDGYSPVTVNVSGGGGGGENFQALWTSGSASSAGQSVLLGPLVVEKAGVYTVRWVMSRGSNSATVATYLSKNGAEYAEVEFDSTAPGYASNRVFLVAIEDVPLAAGDELVIKGRYVSGATSVLAANLVIEEQSA